MMNRVQMVDYIRNQMLSDPSIDEDAAYAIAKIAYNDDDMYLLMNQWVDSIDELEKDALMFKMLDQLKDMNDDFWDPNEEPA